MHTVFSFCRQHRRILLLCLLLLVFTGTILSVALSYRVLTVTSHTLYADIAAPVRVVHLSDLHGAVFGEDNRRLCDHVANLAPDLILITGDTVNMWEPDVTKMTALLARLSEIAPVYLSLGNHEMEHIHRFRSDFTRFWSEYVTVLDFSLDTIDIDGVRVAVGGLYGYCASNDTDIQNREQRFLASLTATDADVRLLLSHMPLFWTRGEAATEWHTLTAVFSGHNHGGQIILPFIGGMYAPDIGFFPGKVAGRFEKPNAVPVFVSRGLGSGSDVPRFHNLPQILVVDILPTP